MRLILTLMSNANNKDYIKDFPFSWGKCEETPCECRSEQKHYLLQLLLLLQSEHLHLVADLDFVVLAGADSRLADLDGTFQIGPPHTVHVPEQKGWSWKWWKCTFQLKPRGQLPFKASANPSGVVFTKGKYNTFTATAARSFSHFTLIFK